MRNCGQRRVRWRHSISASIPGSRSRAPATQSNDDQAPRPDGRRDRGRLREQAIVDAAYALFLTHGYRGTTLQAIIARAGGSRETIYRALGGKRGLLSRIISRVGDPIAAGLDEQDVETPPRQALRAFALELMTFWSSPEGLAMNRMVFSEGIAFPEIIEDWYQSAVRPSLDATTRYLERQQRSGRVYVGDTAVAARQFLLLLMAEAAFAFVLSSGASRIEPIVDDALDLLLKSVKISSVSEFG